MNYYEFHIGERASNIHAARGYLAQSRHFTRRHRNFSFVLLDWARNSRLRATEKAVLPMQLELL